MSDWKDYADTWLAASEAANVGLSPEAFEGKQFWLLDVYEDVNVLRPLIEQVLTLVPVVDEDAGGIIAYATPANAQRIIDLLNKGGEHE